MDLQLHWRDQFRQSVSKGQASLKPTRHVCLCVCVSACPCESLSIWIYTDIQEATHLFDCFKITTTQCAYNVTLRGVSATIVAVERNKCHLFWVCVCVCSFKYPAFNAHAINCHVACPAITNFSTLSQTAQFFKEKSLWTQNVCFDFLYNFCLQHFSFWEEVSEIWS